MAKSKFLSYKEPTPTPNPTLDKSKIIEDFGWYEQEISLSKLLKLVEGKDLDKVYVALSYMDDPYNENPHLLLINEK